MYLKTNISDYFLCVAATCAFSHTVLSGFYTPAALQNNIILLIGVTAIVSMLLFIGAYNKKTVVAAVIAFAVLAAGFFVLSRNAGLDALSDNANNRYLYFVILTLSAGGVFLLSRTRIGSVVLFTVGTFVLCVIRFLYETNHLIPFILFIVCAGAIYLRSYYRLSVKKTVSKKTAHVRSAVSYVLVMAVALGLASGVYFGVVKMIDPPSRDLKLITHYLSLETLQKMGIADNLTVPDDELTSSKTNDEENKTKAGNKNKKETKSGAEKPNDDLKNDRTKPNTLDVIKNAFFKVISYLFSRSGWWIIPLAVIFAILSTILIKLYRRKRWISKQNALTPEAQVKSMYAFYIKKLRHMKIRKPNEATLFEFDNNRRDVLSRFGTAQAGFGELTSIYVKALYGEEPATHSDVEVFRAFHAGFYKKCRAYLGGFRYAIKFFVL